MSIVKSLDIFRNSLKEIATEYNEHSCEYLYVRAQLAMYILAGKLVREHDADVMQSYMTISEISAELDAFWTVYSMELLKNERIGEFNDMFHMYCQARDTLM